MNIRLLSLGFMAWLLPLAAVLAGESVTIGTEKLSIPLPAGYARLDGKNPSFDQLMEKFVVSTNRLLLMAAPSEIVKRVAASDVPDLERYVVLQTFRAGEGRTASLKDFETIYKSVEKEMGGDSIANLDQKVNEQLKKSNLPVEMKMGEVRPLGLFHKDDRSCDFGLLSKLQMGPTDVTTLATAASVVIVRGKVVYLYVYSVYHGDQDIAWVRTTVQSWREAILAENPGGTPKGGFDFGSVGNSAVIGGIIGGVAGLMAMIFRKKKNPAPPPI
jgi:hypothetical protein